MIEVDWNTIILAVISGGGIFKICEMLFNRFCKKKDDKDELKKAVQLLLDKSRERDLEISKILLTILMEHSPDDERAIVEEATRYFGDLGGDSWMYGRYKAWADAHNVDTEYIKSLHDKNMKAHYGKKSS